MTRIDTLDVPGATLYHEVRGSGPVLLLICGGVYDAAGYTALAELLADRYTVVTYDRRGNSRSPLDGPPRPQRIEAHADDAYRLLTALGVTPAEPAYVFGNSSGAMIGLGLAARHPELVRVLVAHEPPVFELLPDRDHWRALLRDVAAAFAKAGAEAANQVLAAAFAAETRAASPTANRQPGPGSAAGGSAPGAVAGSAGSGPVAGQSAPVSAVAAPERIPGGAEAPAGEPDPETAAMLARIGRNMEFFVGYEVPPFGGHLPDLDGLRNGSVQVRPAVGEASTGQPPYRAAVAVAERLGEPPVVFPGDHGGFGDRAEAFAARLHEVLSAG
ncbi:alpha/beta fold hydrolase [Micromonospora sp. WMMD1102]|uniref:alpha/beta fold hydrolase n=1 Tax=Micromonospora sp. WMMD1102 TaxID=3016105 RepID=UPI0024158A91|nr:alpha/beta fold hydrolase [Micromonospora sp. WMMD1102]MDG4786807.1 alpha/beta fold hydrolase [Micromonospora sp. WMMD1102]